MHPFDKTYEVTVNHNSIRNDPSKYIQALKRVCTLTSAEELKYFLQHLKPFNDLLYYNVNVFKKGIDASWEDEMNAKGCSWIVNFKIECSRILFERLCVFLCLEGFKTFDCNGVKINIRKGFVKFEIWASKLPNDSENNNVLDELRTALGLDYAVNFSHQSHQELIDKFVLANS